MGTGLKVFSDIKIEKGKFNHYEKTISFREWK